MRSFLSRRLGSSSSSRTSDGGSLFSYRSSNAFEHDRNGLPSTTEDVPTWVARESYTSPEGIGAARDLPPSSFNAQGVIRSSTSGYVRVYHGAISALISCTNNYEALEQAIRDAYVIKDDTPLFLSTNIALLNSKRMGLDHKAWSLVYNDIRELWVATLPQYHTLPRKILLEPIDQTNGGQAVTVKIGENGTIGDIKQAFIQRFPLYSSTTIFIWSCGECEIAGTLTNNLSAGADRYQISQLLKVEFRGRDIYRPNSTVGDTSLGVYRNSGTSFKPVTPAKDVLPTLRSAAKARVNTSQLLVMHYGDSVALTRCEDRYEDVEQSARDLFLIDQSTHVFITGKISPSEPERARIDPRLWASVPTNSMEIWIATETGQPKSRLVPLLYKQLSLCVAVKVEESSMLVDIKRAFGKLPGFADAQIGILGPKSTATNDYHLAVEGYYRFWVKCSGCVQKGLTTGCGHLWNIYAGWPVQATWSPR